MGITTTQPVGRPPSVSRSDVVECATRVVRIDGYDALSMRRLGRELGVDAMVPYRLFPSKDALLDVVYDHVVTDSEPQPSGDPVSDVITAFANFWRDLVDHPGLLPLVTPRMMATRAAMAPFEWVMVRLTTAGLTRDRAIVWYTTLLGHVLGTAAIHPDVQQRSERIDPRSLPPHRYPTISGLDTDIDHDRLYEDGLRRLEDAIRREAEG